MTALEYMEKQVQKHLANFSREYSRGASSEALANIRHKISYYAEAAEALKKVDEVDSTKAVHGRWCEDVDEYGICATEFTCSVCGEMYCIRELTDKQFLKTMRFCPNCGVKMEDLE